MKSNIFFNEFYLIYSAIHINSDLEFELMNFKFSLHYILIEI